MARLALHKGGKAFFDVILAQRGNAIYAIANLRIPKSPHCSGFVVHDEFTLGHADEARHILSKSFLELSGGTMRFKLNWNGQGHAHFEARCDSGAGFVAIKAAPEVGSAKRFIKRLASIAQTMAKGT